MDDPLLTASAAAQMLGITERHLRKLAKDKPGGTFGGVTRFGQRALAIPASDVLEYRKWAAANPPKRGPKARRVNPAVPQVDGEELTRLAADLRTERAEAGALRGEENE